jgi:biotin carboxyl carrier protein
MFTEPFRLSADDRHHFDFQPEEAKSLDVIRDGKGEFHILYKNRSYHAELLEVDYAARHYVFRINGSKHTVKIADHYERLAQQLGLNVGGGHKMNAVRAPMPGLVLDVIVRAGQSVQKGDPLLILEAMKMENVIKAGGEGRVRAVKVDKGAAVDKGHLLLEME